MELRAAFARAPDGSVALTLDGTGLEAATLPIPRTWPTHGMTAGLSCGEDRGHPVSDDYPRPNTFRGGRLRQVIVEVEVYDGVTPAAGKPADVIALED